MKERKLQITGESLSDFGFGNVLKYNTKSTLHERKTDKLDFTKIKKFCSLKGIVKRIETCPEQEQTFAKHISDKGLVFKIYQYKELLK